MPVLLATHPIEIYQACDEIFKGQPWLSWEPETILLQLKEDVSDLEIDKLLAVQAVAANSNAVLRSAAAFEKVVNAFCNNVCVMDVIQPPEVEEMSYAVSQIEKIIKAVHGKVKIEYTDEVPGYVASTAKFRGWFALPKNLRFGQELLDSLTQAHNKEHKELVDNVTALIKNTTRKDAREILADPEISKLETDDMASLLVKQIIGALLFDPTVEFRRQNAQTGTKTK